MNDQIQTKIEAVVDKTAEKAVVKSDKEDQGFKNTEEIKKAISTVGENYAKTVREVMEGFDKRLSSLTTQGELMGELSKMKAQSEARYEELTRKLADVTFKTIATMDSRLVKDNGWKENLEKGYFFMSKVPTSLAPFFMSMAVLKSAGTYVRSSSELDTPAGYMDVFYKKADAKKFFTVPARSIKLTDKQTKNIYFEDINEIIVYDNAGAVTHHLVMHNDSKITDLDVIPSAVFDYESEKKNGKDAVTIKSLGTGSVVLKSNHHLYVQPAFDLTPLITQLGGYYDRGN